MCIDHLYHRKGTTNVFKEKGFSNVDAKNGLWHVELNDESPRLTNFDSSSVRFCWRRLSLEVCAALEGVRTIHDDIQRFGEGSSEDEELVDRDQNLRSLMQRCIKQNVWTRTKWDCGMKFLHGSSDLEGWS